MSDRDVKKITNIEQLIRTVCHFRGTYAGLVPNRSTISKNEVRLWRAVFKPIEVAGQKFDHMCVPTNRRLYNAMNKASVGDIIEFTATVCAYKRGSRNLIGCKPNIRGIKNITKDLIKTLIV